jgi:hypothetical protein
MIRQVIKQGYFTINQSPHLGTYLWDFVLSWSRLARVWSQLVLTREKKGKSLLLEYK